MTIAAKIEETIEIPEGVNVEISGSKVTVSGPKGQLAEEYKTGPIKITKLDKTVKVSVIFPKKKQKAMIGTMIGKIDNMINGVLYGYEYHLQVVYTHFPMNVSVEGQKVIIKNFLGEKHPRSSKIKGDVQVKIKGQEITVTGTSKEEVGQTSANMVLATKIRKRDQRVFKDGIFVVEKRVMKDEQEKA